MTLTEFLLDRIAEDEEVARVAIREGVDEWEPLAERGTNIYGHPYAVGAVMGAAGGSVQINAGTASADLAEHIARHDPARVLAECEARRRIVMSAQQAQESLERRRDPTPADVHGHVIALREVIRLLALPYADHPDYRDEWKP